MEIHERIKLLRNNMGMSQSEFGKMLGTTRDVIGNIEYNRLKRPEQKEPIYNLICEKLKVNERWLRYGEGEMFIDHLPTDEIGDIISEVIENKNDSFYKIILEAMKYYYELDEKSKQVIRKYTSGLVERIKEEEG
ncbi:helix-turn-helix protein [Cuneatibacter caecimuris]|uniref:Helix-turn-helix protein n=2 Tax=Cuneatibacter caecimuris TaxID=1796618 RepID=A0A4Q7PPS1_9FIRM|nr:helix-turn-helix protein [Cuneatibacter caecimuris]